MLYSRSLLVILIKYSSVYMSIPNSLTIPSLYPSPASDILELATQREVRVEEAEHPRQNEGYGQEL